ncbi:MAG: GTP-binding protein YchF, partial [Candidatus Uhrbacteria bacterium GW2011_GWE2_45_35]
HVVRSFEDTNVHHVSGNIDPLRDSEIIELELAMADLDVVQKRLENLGSKIKTGKTKELEDETSALQKILAAIQTNQPARSVELSDDEQKAIKGLELLTLKPVLYILNVDEKTAANPNWQNPLRPDCLALPLSVKIESEIMEMPADEQKVFLDSLSLKQSGLDRMILKCYELLNLITFLTSGEKESRAWTIKKGTKAPQAAGVIHTDFEKAFICAEIIDWKDFVELGEAKAREAGKLRTEGKNYVMKDGDTCNFKVGV